MAKYDDDIGGVWRTIGGRRVFIRNGEDLASAMKRSGKFKKAEINKKPESDEAKEEQVLKQEMPTREEKLEYIKGIENERARKNLTNSPVLDEMTLDDIKMYEDIQNGKTFSYDELYNSNVVQSAEKFNDDKGSWYIEGDEPSPDQMKKFEYAQDKFIEDADLDSKSNNREAVLVVGLPSSGKSTAVADEMLKKYNAVEMDNDKIKPLFKKEYNDGKGANYVQNASSYVSENMVLPKLTQKGTNLVIPVVGKKESSLMAKIDLLKKNNYDVKIVDVELDKQKALNRAYSRYVDKGRYVSLKYIGGIDENKIKANYETAKKSGKVSGWQIVDNNVKFGEKAKVVENGGEW